jgi:Zn-dependent peptidase ImmA (M78 family)
MVVPSRGAGDAENGGEPLWLKSPHLLLEHLGIDEPAEIEIEPVAQACGATIVYEPLQGCEARLIGAGRRAVITVNSAAGRARQRFSAAHELGHWVHDRGKVAFSCAEGQFLREWGPERDQQNAERRANRFAAGLLLPRNMFKRRARHRPMTFATVTEMAAEFETSVTATAIRLVELGALPAMLVCYHKWGRRWTTRNPLVPEALQPHLQITPQTLAASGAARGDPSGVQPYPAEAWLAHPDAVFHTIYADTWVSGPETLLVMLAWKDEDFLRDVTVAEH